MVEKTQLNSLIQDHHLNFKTALFFSFLVHLVFLAIILGLAKSGKGAVKEANYLVVNFIPRIEVEGLKKETPLKVPSKSQGEATAVNFSTPESKSPESNLNKDLMKTPVTESQISPTSLVNEQNPGQAPKEIIKIQPAGRQYHFPLRTNSPPAAIGLKHFYLNINEKVIRLLQDCLSLETSGAPQEKQASVKVSFTETGVLQSVTITPDSDEDLARHLQDKIPWSSLNPPWQFGLPNKEVELKIQIDSQGNIKVNTTLL